jgi:hypothetical protein
MLDIVARGHLSLSCPCSWWSSGMAWLVQCRSPGPWPHPASSHGRCVSRFAAGCCEEHRACLFSLAAAPLKNMGKIPSKPDKEFDAARRRTSRAVRARHIFCWVVFLWYLGHYYERIADLQSIFWLFDACGQERRYKACLECFRFILSHGRNYGTLTTLKDLECITQFSLPFNTSRSRPSRDRSIDSSALKNSWLWNICRC